MNPAANQNSPFRVALVGLLSLAIAMGIGRFAFTPLLPLMQDDGLVSIADGGVLASVHFLGYWIGAVLAAKVPFSPKTILRFSLIAIGVCTLGMGLIENFYVWLFLRWLSGVCSAFTLIVVSNFYVKQLAQMGFAHKQGWIFSGVGAGIAVAGLGTMAIMAGEIGSTVSWQIIGVTTLAVGFALCRYIGSEIDHTLSKHHERNTESSSLNWRIIIPYGALGIGYVIPATYLPVMARETIQSPLVFGWAWPVFGAAAFLSTLLVARVPSYYSNRRIWATSQIIMALGLLSPVVYPHIISILIAGACVGGTFMIITMMGMKEAHRIAPANDVLRHIAVMTTAFATGQIVGPVLASSIYDLTKSFSVSLVLTSMVLIVTALMLMRGSSDEPEVGARGL